MAQPIGLSRMCFGLDAGQYVPSCNGRAPRRPEQDLRSRVLPLGQPDAADVLHVEHSRFCSVSGSTCRSHIDIARQGYADSFLGVTNERNLVGMGDDNVRFVILLVMGVVVAVAVFSYFLFMSEIHIG